MKIQENVSLKPYNLFQIDVKAKEFVEITSEEELRQLFLMDIFKSSTADSHQVEGGVTRKKILVLGGGANVLLTKDFDGLVIRFSRCSDGRGIQVLEDVERSSSQDKVLVKVRAGEHWSDFVEFCDAQGRGGLEKLIDIPGTIGGAAVGNIGAYGVEAGDLIEEVRGYDLETLEYQVFGHEECRFGYRTSLFKEKLKAKRTFLVTEVVFGLHIEDPALSPHFSESLQQVSQEIRSIRASKLPDWREIGTAGSFFKNPVVSSQLFSSLQEKFEGIVGYQLDTASVGSEELDGSRAEKNVKLSAAWLIEHAGMKGFRYGTAGVYEKHALILVNYGGGSEDVLEVMKRVQVAVQEKFGIVLEPEVVIV